MRSTGKHEPLEATGAGESRPAAPARLVHVFLVFLRLGLTSFGAPVAHPAYFRAEFVERRRWLSERNYADVVALCQFLPGALAGVNAAAVGLLLAALYRPVWTSVIFEASDAGLALLAFAALAFWKLPPWLVVLACGAAGWLLGGAA